jgi:TrmH family RNA methyltransferase
MIKLTASQNPLIKEVRMLKNKSAREKKGLYFIEGTRFVSEALKFSKEIRYLVVSESFSNGEQMKQIEGSFQNIYQVPDSLFRELSDTQTPQGILAVMGIKYNRLDEAELSGGLLVILDSIKDPGNMGTIIRTADAAGCTGIIVPEGCVDIYNPKVLRSTMGSIFHLPVFRCENISQALETAKNKGFKLCASHLEGAVSIYEADLSGSTALVIGSEAEGICRETIDKADLLIKIPMEGKAESLNASVAAGIMIFEAMRQRLASH